MLDYLVVGLGLAGLSLCERLEENGKSFKVISDGSQQSSLVAGGLYNPVILKRFTLAWKAGLQMPLIDSFYGAMEKKLNLKFDYKLPVYRRLVSSQEQNLWFEAADKKGLADFLSTAMVTNDNPHIDAPFGFGEVMHTGRIDTEILLNGYSQYLLEKSCLEQQAFDHNQLQINESYVTYRDLRAKRIVFAEGFGLKHNPYFNYLPLNGTKGELLTIRAPQLREGSVIKSSVFIIPLGEDHYLIGATYKWKDKTSTPTEASKMELLEKLRTFLKCDFEVVDHVAGIRPTVTDRRPLVGQHPKYKNLYLLNGFGSRGVLIAPYASQQLFDQMERNKPLDPEMDIHRFQKKFQNRP